jgi:hypothetical protein
MNRGIEHVDHLIEMDEALALHETGWKVQRVGWICFMLIIVLALLGLFGNGVLSRQKSETGGNMIEYERFGRYESSTTLHIVARTVDGKAVVRIPQHYLQHFELERIIPSPVAEGVHNGYCVYSFTADESMHILLYGMLKRRGSLEADVKVNNTALKVSQFIFP